MSISMFILIGFSGLGVLLLIYIIGKLFFRKDKKKKKRYGWY
jgi:hypothetical protein